MYKSFTHGAELLLVSTTLFPPSPARHSLTFLFAMETNKICSTPIACFGLFLFLAGANESPFYLTFLTPTDELVHEKEKYKHISDDLDNTFFELTSY
jgi:hypothetical protein